jgi:hypothetical protein
VFCEELIIVRNFLQAAGNFWEFIRISRNFLEFLEQNGISGVSKKTEFQLFLGISGIYMNLQEFLGISRNFLEFQEFPGISEISGNFKNF